MAEAEGMHSYGAQLFYAPYATANPEGIDAGASGFTALAEVLSVSGIGGTFTVTKVTHLSSPGKAHEKVPGFLDAGQASLKLNYARGLMAIIEGLRPLATDDQPDWGRLQWVVQLPDGGQFYFTGFVQGTPIEVPEDDRITIELTVEISGRPEFTAGP